MKQGSLFTILFADLVGSTGLFDHLGDVDADDVRREHFAALRSAARAHDGRVVKSPSDPLMVGYSSAVASLRCAVDMQRATEATRPGLKAGLDACEPRAEGDDLYGTATIGASLLCESARAGEMLASDLACGIAGRALSALIEPTGPLGPHDVSHHLTAPRLRWGEEAAGSRGRLGPAWRRLSGCRRR